MLFDAGWAVVSWPEAYGGRDASLWEWLIFEEEYYRAGGPQRVTQNGIFLLAPTLFEFGTPEQQDAHPAAHGGGRGPVVPGLVGARTPGRDLASLAVAGRDEVDGGWRLNGQKTWTTRGAFCTAPVRPVPHRPRQRSATGASRYFLVPLDTDGVTVRGLRPARRRRGLRRGVPRGRVRARRRPRLVLGERRTRAGRWRWRRPASERGLTLRSPGPLPRRRRPAGRAVPTSAAAADDLRRAIGRRRGWTPRPTGCSALADRHHAGRGRPDRRRVVAQQAVLVGARRAAARDRRSTCSAPRPSSRAPWIEGLPVRAVGPDLRRHQRDPAQHRRRARARPAEERTAMRASPADDGSAVSVAGYRAGQALAAARASPAAVAAGLLGSGATARRSAARSRAWTGCWPNGGRPALVPPSRRHRLDNAGSCWSSAGDRRAASPPDVVTGAPCAARVRRLHAPARSSPPTCGWGRCRARGADAAWLVLTAPGPSSSHPWRRRVRIEPSRPSLHQARRRGTGLAAPVDGDHLVPGDRGTVARAYARDCSGPPRC